VRAVHAPLLIVLAACDPGPNGTLQDAGPGSGGGTCTQTPPTPSCGSSDICGNNRIDNCWYQPMPGHCYWQPWAEMCDGTATKSCQELGYFGGNTVCSLSCNSIDFSGCNACAPSDLACGTFAPIYGVQDLAVSGTHVALGAGNVVAIFDGITPIARVTVPDFRALAPTSSGWLVASEPLTLTPLDFAGNLGTPQSTFFRYPKLVTGPGGRILSAWKYQINAAAPWHVQFSIVDSAGITLVPTTDLFTLAADHPFDVATDGTSFFVGAEGQLARITSDGSATIVTGYPVAAMGVIDSLSLTWQGTTGWYVNAYDAQRFDASATPVGTQVILGNNNGMLDMVGTGTDLLGIRNNNLVLQLVRVDTAGDATALSSVGTYLSSSVRMAWRATDLVVAWGNGDHLLVALVVP
jgi:hypothetical protein